MEAEINARDFIPALIGQLTLLGESKIYHIEFSQRLKEFSTIYPILFKNIKFDKLPTGYSSKEINRTLSDMDRIGMIFSTYDNNGGYFMMRRNIATNCFEKVDVTMQGYLYAMATKMHQTYLENKAPIQE